MQADTPLKNEESLRGKIALVQRGSSSGIACSFVEKATRVENAGAVGMVLVNTEDSMISPGDSAREGGDVNIPVVGIRSSDLPVLRSCETEEVNVSLTFKPISPLTTQQRKHLRAFSANWCPCPPSLNPKPSCPLVSCSPSTPSLPPPPPPSGVR